MKNSNIKIGTNKSFGIIFFIFFLLISLWPLLNNEKIRVWSLIISFIFIILALVKPYVLTPLNRIWAKFGVILGGVISPIVMGIVFFVIVTPTGFLMRVFSKDFLNLKKNNNKTYWIESSSQKSKMKNQF